LKNAVQIALLEAMFEYLINEIQAVDHPGHGIHTSWICYCEETR
jgi:hypothetical protein